MEKRNVNKETKEKEMYGELGKYLLDISKLVFGGIVLAGIMKIEVNNIWLLIWGATAVLLLALCGFIFYLLSK